ncbi:MAG: alpha/beta hydrolase [bacterium]|nr:alpha/beta hydrolase [bacterium]
MRTPDQIEKVYQAARQDFAGWTRNLVNRMFLPTSDPALRDFVIRNMSAAPPEIAEAAGRATLQWDGRAALNAFDKPKWMINSDYRPNNQEVAEKYGLKVVAMSGVGHFVMMEDPETFNSLLNEVVKQCQQAV